MGMSLEKFKLVEKVKLSYLKHRGNVLLVSGELDLPVDFVRKQIGKFRKKEEKDIQVLISNTLMQSILLGYQQRVYYLQDLLRKLEGREQVQVSICCHAPIRRAEGEAEYTDRHTWICTKCHAIAEPTIVDKQNIYEIVQKTVELLRAEDTALVDFADKMGYTNKETAPIFKKTEYNLTIGNGKLSKSDSETFKEIRTMDPQTREKIRKNLEQKIAANVVEVA